MWDIVEKISTLEGIISGAIVIGTLVIYLTRRYRYKRRIEKAIKAGKGLKAALIVGLKAGENIRGHVETYLKENGMEMEISEIDKEGVSIHTISELRKTFIRKKRELSERGVKEVHLFYEGPVASAFFLADCLNNWVPVYVYHFHRDGGYENWGILTESLERMATEELIRGVSKDA
ncbi:MAG: SAVED domain-containing protein [Nitrospinota bacterium]